MRFLLKNIIIERSRLFLSRFRKRKVKRNFCIISNNCWGGKVYQRFGKQYNSPTIGLYFFADDYIRFLKNIRKYIEIPVKIIKTEESKHYDCLVKNGQRSVVVGVIDDVEIIFLHYKTPEEAINKWERRKKRIDWDNLIVKFSKMNECTEKHIEEFDSLNFNLKFVFVNDKHLSIKNAVYINGYDNRKEITDDTTHYSSYIDLLKMINERTIISKNRVKL